MRVAVFVLAVISCAVALPVNLTFDEVDFENLIPNNIYLKAIGPPQVVDLPEERVIGGTVVARNSVPYQAAIIINGVTLCGGSLISTTRVLTAAHCTIRASSVQVRLGAHAFNSNEATQRRITSTSIRNHANYNVSSFAANDIAIINLPSAVTLNSYIAVVGLAETISSDFENVNALLTGWGRTSDAWMAYPATLRGVTVTVISNAVCRNSYGDDIVAGSLCTAGTRTVIGGPAGACQGDSGGPLVRTTAGLPRIQIGIVSFRDELCESEQPTVFTRISTFRGWIIQNSV